MHKAMVYIHGKGGNAEEAEHYRILFPKHEVLGFPYQSENPWEAQKEFSAYFRILQKRFDSINIIANSIGAYFALNSLNYENLEKAFFISPIVNMEKLILDMLRWANATEAELERAGTIETDFGETLSWEYLSWVRKHPLHWSVPTAILYGNMDHLQTKETIEAFANWSGAELTIMENGEHWFHTEEQMAFLDRWLTGQRL